MKPGPLYQLCLDRAALKRAARRRIESRRKGRKHLRLVALRESGR